LLYEASCSLLFLLIFCERLEAAHEVVSFVHTAHWIGDAIVLTGEIVCEAKNTSNCYMQLKVDRGRACVDSIHLSVHRIAIIPDSTQHPDRIAALTRWIGGW